MIDLKINTYPQTIFINPVSENKVEKVVRNLNPFSGGFFNTMSHLPGRVVNFKNPSAWPFYSGYRKN
jgi:hypothetical protein